MWNNDACMFNCLTHTIFNRSDPQHAYGNFFVDTADRLVNVSVIDSSTSAVYTGDRFGCQLSLVNQVCALGCLSISLIFPSAVGTFEASMQLGAFGIYWGRVWLPALTCQPGALLEH